MLSMTLPSYKSQVLSWRSTTRFTVRLATQNVVDICWPTLNRNHCVCLWSLVCGLYGLYLIVSSTQTLPYALSVLKKAGYKMVSVADCLGQQPYKSVGPPGNITVSLAFPDNFLLWYQFGRPTGRAKYDLVLMFDCLQQSLNYGSIWICLGLFYIPLTGRTCKCKSDS